MKPALLLLWLACCSATSRPTHWTAPSDAVTRRVEAIVRPSSGIEYAPGVYADSAHTRPHVPAGIGQRDSAWVWPVPDDRSTYVLWLAACNGAGCSPWSNRAIGAAGLPDTLFTIARGPGWRPLREYPWKRSVRGRVGWSLVPGDSARATIYHQEAMQRANSARIVQIYPSLGWALRGAYILVPDRDAPPVDLP